MFVDSELPIKSSHFLPSGWFQRVSCLLAIVSLALIALPAGAQSYSTLYSFTGGSAGLGPYVGVTMDHAGNLYGTTANGGYLGGNCLQDLGCGLVYKLTPHGSDWTLIPLYGFMGGNDGNLPLSRVVFGPDGALYGTTQEGGIGCYLEGCGTIFRLAPPANFCRSILCPWTETVLHRFNGFDGEMPMGDLVFDQSGNIYGTTVKGGMDNDGTVFQLSHSSGEWVLNTLLSFSWGNGAYPESGVIFDQAGNLYGSTDGGGDGVGVIFELVPLGSSWVDTTLYIFQDGFDGGDPSGGLIFDSAGNLYGATFGGGADGRGTVYELSPSNGNWTLTPLHSFTGGQGGGTNLASLTWDPAGNLYGVSTGDGLYDRGFVFELRPSNGVWGFTDLYDFPAGGGNPYGTLLWNNGTLYGTTLYGGTDGLGTMFGVTP
jgi:uncharacterized repeat protein (TIGR03803 family)